MAKLQRIVRRGTGDYVTVRRAQIVLASVQGASPREIARMFRTRAEHVREVIHAFNDVGVDALEPRWYLEGAPRKFDEATRARIVKIATSRPRDVGAPFTEWSLAKLQGFLMEEGVVEEISLETIRRMLAEEQISYQRLKTWKQSPDPDYEAKKNRVLRTRRMARHGIPVVALDEFGPLSLRPWPGQGWYRQKRPRRRRATFTRDKGIRHFMGGYDLTRNELFGELVASKNRFAFIDLLKAARKRFPRSKRLYVICDNLSSHETPEVLAYCNKHRISLVFTPTYASWLNPIECHFGPLRRFVIDGSDYASHDDLGTAIRDYLRWRNTHRDQAQPDLLPNYRCKAA